MKYVFTCIAEKKNDIYFLMFPDFDNVGVCDADLYSALKIAHNVITVETYVKEQERVVMSEPKNAVELAKALKEGQWTACITVDTGAFAENLELYDSVKTEDLQEFLKNKKEEYRVQTKALKKSKKTAIVESVEGETTEAVKAESAQAQSLTDTAEFEDSVEVVPISEKPKENSPEKTSAKKDEQSAKTDAQPRVKRQRPKHRYNNRKNTKSESANSSDQSKTSSLQNEQNN